jgi:phosphoribosyl-ATP pyrophosphohydrolase
MTDRPSDDSLERLAAVIESRLPAHGGDPAASYVARLFAKGLDAILKKVGEESTEVVMAAKDLAAAPQDSARRQAVINETADLWFHSMIALAQFGLKPADVIAELRRREGLSGLEEFALRKAREREDAEASPPQEGTP